MTPATSAGVGRADRLAARRSGLAHVEPRVAVLAGAREALRAAALGVEVGQLARDAGEAVAVVVDHPGLERDAGAGGAQAEHARLLGIVGERGRADEPEP